MICYLIRACNRNNHFILNNIVDQFKGSQPPPPPHRNNLYIISYIERWDDTMIADTDTDTLS